MKYIRFGVVFDSVYRRRDVMAGVMSARFVFVAAITGYAATRAAMLLVLDESTKSASRRFCCCCVVVQRISFADNC